MRYRFLLAMTHLEVEVGWIASAVAATTTTRALQTDFDIFLMRDLE